MCTHELSKVGFSLIMQRLQELKQPPFQLGTIAMHVMEKKNKVCEWHPGLYGIYHVMSLCIPLAQTSHMAISWFQERGKV